MAREWWIPAPIYGGRPYAGGVVMGSRIRRPLHNRHSGTRAGIQRWGFRVEPHTYSVQYGLSLAVMQRSPSGDNGGGGRFAGCR